LDRPQEKRAVNFSQFWDNNKARKAVNEILFFIEQLQAGRSYGQGNQVTAAFFWRRGSTVIAEPDDKSATE